MIMKLFVPILFVLASIASCAPPESGEAKHTLDTLQSVLRTDTGSYIKNSYLIDGLETTVELRKARGEGLTEPFMRYAYGYDTIGNKILTITSAYNPLKKDYVHISKEEFEYDDNHNPTLSTLFTEKRGQWYPEQRLGRTFDARGNVATLETYEPNGGDWVIKTKTFFEYDNYGNITVKTDFRADDKGEWSPVEKVQREYNKSQMVMEIVSGPAPGNKWAEKSKAEYEYNVGKQCIKQTSYVKRGNKWVNYVRVEYTYDGGGNMLDCETYFWNEKTGSWSFHEKEEF